VLKKPWGAPGLIKPPKSQRLFAANRESQPWLERQMRPLVPADYFLLTFTLPAERRGLAAVHAEVVRDRLRCCAWETVRTSSRNDKQSQGTPGAIAVLHTHSRWLEHHPHVHLVVPATGIAPSACYLQQYSIPAMLSTPHCSTHAVTTGLSVGHASTTLPFADRENPSPSASDNFVYDAQPFSSMSRFKQTNSRRWAII